MEDYKNDSFIINIASQDDFNLNNYVKKVEKILEINLNNCLKSSYVLDKEGIFMEKFFFKRFSITGSFFTYNKQELGVALKYFNKDGRLRLGGTGKNEALYTRGYRYLVALDSNLSVLQKLEILFEDIQDGMDYIIQNEIQPEQQYILLAPVLDYIKNSIVTIYNAYTHKEKLGNLDLDNVDYQNNKQRLIKFMKKSVFAYYASLVNRFNYKMLMSYLEAFEQQTLSQIKIIIQNEYREFAFSSRAIARPEASNPLVLAGFAYNICKKYQDTDIVVGLPSGGTELACLVQQFLKQIYKSSAKLVLLPISTHTTKDSYGLNDNVYSKFNSLFDGMDEEKHRNVLLIDDNSATGKSLEIAKQIILKKFKNITLYCGVPEADLIRIKQNIEEGKKEITSDIVFNNSISVLPISKRTHRKNDLKEVIESHVLCQYYYRKSINADNLVEKIKNEIISEAIGNKTERIRPNLNRVNAILEFKHGFLSNFYHTPIAYRGTLYASVEHAYLDQQYRTDLLVSLNSSQKYELNEVFRIKGMYIKHADFSRIFKEQTYPAGVAKRISTIVKKWGIEVDDWENKRLNIMIELQLLKYSEPFLKSLLLKTEDKYLLEGNSWNDTYWGYSDNRGKNFLGRIIMKVRTIMKEDVTIDFRNITVI